MRMSNFVVMSLTAAVIPLGLCGCGAGPDSDSPSSRPPVESAATPGSSDADGGADSEQKIVEIIPTATSESVGLRPLAQVDLSGFDLESVEVPDSGEAGSNKRGSFTPPTLEELEARTDWEDVPTVDVYERIREYRATLPQPPSADAVAGMRNESTGDNEAIALFYGQAPPSREAIDYDAEFVISEPADVKTTNPLVQSSVIEQRLQGYIGLYLWGFDRDLEPFALADTVESFRRSGDGKVYLLKMRDDLVWSDGEPVTAHDVEFSYAAIMDREVPAVAVRMGTEDLLGVKAYDDLTVAYFHPESRATNIWNCNYPIIPRHVYSESIYAGQPAGTPKDELPETADKTLANSARHVELEDRPVVGGPYEIVERTQNQSIVLRRRNDWFMHDGEEVRTKPHFETVRLLTILDNNTALLSLKSGDIDYLNLTPPQWVNQTSDRSFYGRNVKVRGPEWTTYHIGYNVATPYFDDPRVRRAMGLALDHETMLRDVLYGLYEPSQGVFNPDAWWAADPPPDVLSQDLDRAEDLLAEAGWEDSDSDGVLDKDVDGRRIPFEFSLSFSTSDPNREKVGTLLKENLDQIGIRVNLQPLEFTVLQAKSRNHDFDAQIAGWGVGADPYTINNLWGSQFINGGRNYGRFANADVDRLLEIGARELKRDDRARAYAAVHRILWNEQPYTWLYSRSTFVGMSRDLRGITFSPRDPLGYSGGIEALWKPKDR